MAGVTKRLEVIQIKSQIWALLNRYSVVSVEVAASISEVDSEFLKDFSRWRITESKPSAIENDLRLPPAPDASPVISLETENSEVFMVSVIPALSRSFPGWIIGFVALAIEPSTAEHIARARGGIRHSYHVFGF